MIVARRACMEHSNASSNTCVKYSSATMCSSKARNVSNQRHCCSCCTEYLLRVDLFGISEFVAYYLL